jgi:tetratricopeptide (TPR) repeat protein
MVGLNAMRTRLQIAWVLAATLCLPILSRAQIQKSQYSVSVRELSIPSKALRAYQQGIEHLAKDDAAGSLPHFQRAVAEFASYYEAYFEIGTADLKLSRRAEAEQALRKSIELSGSQYAEPLFALGAVLAGEGKYAQGEETLRKALDLDPTSWAGHYCMGWVLFRLDRPEEAEGSVREALRWKSDSPEAYLLLADIHHRLKDYAAVLKDLDEYLKLEPDSSVNAKVRALRDKAERAIVESQSAAALPSRADSSLGK